MGIIDRFFSKAIQKAVTAQVQGMNYGLTAWSGWGAAVYPASDLDNIIEDGYLGNSNVFAVANLIIRKAASVPVAVYKVKDKKSLKRAENLTSGVMTGAAMQRYKIERIKALGDEIVEGSPFAKLIQNPNDYQGQDAFFESIIGFKVLCGEFFIWANRNDSDTLPPVELYALPPTMVDVIPDPNNVWGVSGYAVNLSGQKIPLRKEDVLHWKGFNPEFDASTRVHLRGVSPFRAGWKDVISDSAAVDADAALKQNRGAIGAVYPKQVMNLTAEQATEFQKRIKGKIEGNDKSGTVAVFQQEFGYLQFALSPADMEVIASRKMNQEQICNILGVPSVLFGTDASSYNNRLSATKELINNTIVPHLAQIRDAMNKWLAPMFKTVDYMDFDITNLPELADDLANLKQVYGDMWQVTPNEVRQLFGFELLPDPNMDKIYIKAGLTTLDEANTEINPPMNNEFDNLNKGGYLI